MLPLLFSEEAAGTRLTAGMWDDAEDDGLVRVCDAPEEEVESEGRCCCCGAGWRASDTERSGEEGLEATVLWEGERTGSPDRERVSGVESDLVRPMLEEGVVALVVGMEEEEVIRVL